MLPASYILMIFMIVHHPTPSPNTLSVRMQEFSSKDTCSAARELVLREARNIPITVQCLQK